MGKVIGKILATEKNPSTMEEFYFWTKPELVLNPFDVVKVEHINDSVTYGVIEEISHITDTASFLAEYISNDFGDAETTSPTFRVGMNYVKARIVENSKGIYTPVHSGRPVCMANKAEVTMALGLSRIQSPIPCGYLEMYQGADENDKLRLPVHLDSRYLIGPEGAHLSISGISGLAAKTSYAMFLMKSIQDKYMSEEPEQKDDVAFVIFNVKGRDLLAIDEPELFDSEEDREKTYEIYREMGITPSPFKNVHYYYPFSMTNSWNTYLEKESVEKNISRGTAHMYKYVYKDDRNNLDLMFAGLDDSTRTMDSILTYISERGEFEKLEDWSAFLKEIKGRTDTATSANARDKDITVQSWRKFSRLISRIIYNNPIFDDIKDPDREIRIGEALKSIHKNEVHVIDIAKLNTDMQSFVFGDAIKAIYEAKLGQGEDPEYDPPSKIIIFIDELNKYASTDTPKDSPILRQVLDIAERGRSLGIILFAAEQFKSAIHPRVTGNCSTFAYGQTNAIEISKSDYKFIPSVYKSMMTRLIQGEYIIQNPAFRSLLNIKFPKPIYKQFK